MTGHVHMVKFRKRKFCDLPKFTNILQRINLPIRVKTHTHYTHAHTHTHKETYCIYTYCTHVHTHIHTHTYTRTRTRGHCTNTHILTHCTNTYTLSTHYINLRLVHTHCDVSLLKETSHYNQTQFPEQVKRKEILS